MPYYTSDEKLLSLYNIFAITKKEIHLIFTSTSSFGPGFLTTFLLEDGAGKETDRGGRYRGHVEWLEPMRPRTKDTTREERRAKTGSGGAPLFSHSPGLSLYVSNHERSGYRIRRRCVPRTPLRNGRNEKRTQNARA
ncbi:hypothetical protein HPB51_009300 [Rhipicephalus microplus]|uniref:Uncharacterized protein n=1 Tax=Rhipicephalus microplus TaxID=6941 RepID=A0A9J6F0R9_RHIMP|nr:hypothetical protein HPB51_009300 [Rhipicephalus microplus]